MTPRAHYLEFTHYTFIIIFQSILYFVLDLNISKSVKDKKQLSFLKKIEKPMADSHWSLSIQLTIIVHWSVKNVRHEMFLLLFFFQSQ